MTPTSNSVSVPGTELEVKLRREAALASCVIDSEVTHAEFWLTWHTLIVSQLSDKDPVKDVILSSGGFNALMASPELLMVTEPVTRISEMREGRVGRALGCDLYTEAYRHPQEQVMSLNEVLFNTASDKWIRLTIKD